MSKSRKALTRVKDRVAQFFNNSDKSAKAAGSALISIENIVTAELLNEELTDDELKALSHSAYEEAMAFGLSAELFQKYFKTVRNRA